MRGMVWFKKDLRVGDHAALYNACQQCGDGVVAVYIVDASMWQAHHASQCQIDFIMRGLDALSEDLQALGISLLVLQAKATSDIPKLLSTICQQYQINNLYYHREYEINEHKRDAEVDALLHKQAVTIHVYDDQFILPPNLLQRDNNEYFKVFTPFKRHWLKQLHARGELTLLPKAKVIYSLKVESAAHPSSLISQTSSVDHALWPAGEKHARQRLAQFIKQDINAYDTKRDFPALDTTSKLSPYLALGMISPRECMRAALIKNEFELDSGNKGVLTWMSELIWREFYRLILIAAPRVCMNKAYKIQTDNLPWRYDKVLLKAWQQGKTGFPLVDAAMRQLNTIGWMHNRLRMVTAMFLSKNLFLDWRLGERYFSEHLIDFDFAANNGGWQWSASTGTDAVPYFRIFNPTTQSERFDPDGDFIRKYCPELGEFSAKKIHNPYSSDPVLAKKCGYPQPVIDYKQSRERVLAAFKGI